MTHDPAGLLGLGQVHGMAPAGDQGRDAVRHEPGQAQRVRGEAGVVRPGQGQDGAGERREAIPQGLLGARPGTVAGSRPGRLALLRSRSERCAAPPEVEPFEHAARAARRR